MTDNEKMIAREEYFEEYRQATEDFTRIRSRIKEEEDHFNQLMSDLQEASEELHHRLSKMRRVITMMLETGYDPVEAKLKIDENMQSTLWHDRHKSSLAVNSLGAMGASGIATISGTGANGAYNGSISIATASSRLRI